MPGGVRGGDREESPYSICALDAWEVYFACED